MHKRTPVAGRVVPKPKTKGNRKKTKDKSSRPKHLSHKPTLRRRELCQKTAKVKKQPSKKQNQKTGSISPFVIGESPRYVLACRAREPPKEREREREREAHHNQDKKKHSVAVDLEENAVHDVWVEGEGMCAGRKDTRGTTNRNAVCVSPAPEEEKKRDATTANKKTTKQQEKKRERERDPRVILTRVGS